MVRTSVYLSPEEMSRLAALAEREGTSTAEVIRRAVRQYERERRSDRTFRLAGSGAGAGGSVADVPDDDLLDGFGS